MGTQIISQGSLAPWNTKILAPVMDSLEGWFDIDTDANRTAFNRASGKPNGVIVGSPTYGATGAKFQNQVACLQTDVAQTDFFTIIMLAKSDAAISGPSNGVFFASTTSGASIDPSVTSNITGISLQANTAIGLQGLASAKNAPTTATNVTANVDQVLPNTSWGFRMLRCAAGELTTANLTGGTSTKTTFTDPRLRNVNKIRIGSSFTAASYAGLLEVSTVALYSRALSDAEAAAVVALMKNRAARLGIVA